MKANIFLGLTLMLSTVLAEECPANSDKVVVCYYSSWSVYREDLGHFSISDINASLCTHLVYTFAGLNLDSKITSLDPTNDIQRGSYNSFTKLKETNPCLKTLLAIGGWNEGSKKYSVVSWESPGSLYCVFIAGCCNFNAKIGYEKAMTTGTILKAKFD